MNIVTFWSEYITYCSRDDLLFKILHIITFMLGLIKIITLAIYNLALSFILINILNLFLLSYCFLGYDDMISHF